MAFDIHDFEQIVDRLTGLNALQEREAKRAVQLGHTALNLSWFLTPPAKTAGHRALDETARVAAQLCAGVLALLADSRVVVVFWRRAQGWTELRERVSAVAGDLDPANRLVGTQWQGRAAAAYGIVTPSQRNAALRLDVVANQLQVSLTWAAEAGVALYAGLVVIVGQLVAALAVAIPLLTGVVTAPAGSMALVAAVATAAAEIAGIVLAAGVGYAWAKVHVNNARSEGFDQSAFPRGAWPDPHTALYGDATVLDGDSSGWAPIAG